MIILREYNLFVIKDNYFKYYIKYPEKLYNLLSLIYYKKCSIEYGINLYSKICKKVDTEILKNYLNSKYNLNNERIFYINGIFINLYNSRITIKSKYNYPQILKIFNYYNRCIFVIDFINNDYFFLRNFKVNILQNI